MKGNLTSKFINEIKVKSYILKREKNRNSK